MSVCVSVVLKPVARAATRIIENRRVIMNRSENVSTEFTQNECIVDEAKTDNCEANDRNGNGQSKRE